MLRVYAANKLLKVFSLPWQSKEIGDGVYEHIQSWVPPYWMEVCIHIDHIGWRCACALAILDGSIHALQPYCMVVCIHVGVVHMHISHIGWWHECSSATKIKRNTPTSLKSEFEYFQNWVKIIKGYILMYEDKCQNIH